MTTLLRPRQKFHLGEEWKRALMSHEAVMPEEVLAAWITDPDGTYIDLSFGAGGHSLAACKRLRKGRIVAFDADPEAVERGKARLALEDLPPGKLELHHGWAGQLAEHARRLHLAPQSVQGILFDTGCRLEQFEDEHRGFSFRFPEAPLDMRFDPTSDRPTAAELLKTLPEAELERIFREFGGDRFSRTIASTICSRREAEDIETVAQLSELVFAAHHRSKERGRDARTQVWQALRMAVNDEAGELEAALEAAESLLAPGGRLVVLTFESTLDRLVKSWMRAKAQKHTPSGRRPVPSAPCKGAAPTFRLVTRKPLRPSEAEVRRNPRARSARLRVAEKLASPGEEVQAKNE